MTLLSERRQVLELVDQAITEGTRQEHALLSVLLKEYFFRGDN
jgi:hypothetical protein